MLPLLLAVVATGCGDDNDEGLPGEPITCEWFTGDNCWRKAATEFGTCASDSQGAFDAGGTTCSMPDGGQVSFASPVPVDIDDNYAWDFTVQNNGTTCGRFQSFSSSSKLLLTTPSGLVRAEGSIAGEVITCPDGSKYSIPLANAFECLFDLPGISWGSVDTGLFVSVLGGDGGSAFDCTR